jgi:hypothetical protein
VVTEVDFRFCSFAREVGICKLWPSLSQFSGQAQNDCFGVEFWSAFAWLIIAFVLVFMLVCERMWNV